MANLTVRGLDDNLHARLRIRAAQHGHSMEAEVRAILKEQLADESSKTGLGSRIHARFASVGHPDLQQLQREAVPRAADFDE